MVQTQALANQNGAPTAGAIESVIALGDLSKLTPDQRSAYYGRVCESLGLNPLTRPFEYLTLQGKLILYARKDCTDQLRSIRKVSLTIPAREVVEGLYVVTARATLPDGRTDEEIGAVNIKGLQGDALANAMMKASTKAKRRVTLSVCGLGMLDETETETIPDARVHVETPAQPALPASHIQGYADKPFTERTGAPAEFAGPPPERTKPAPPNPNPAPDLDDIDAQFEELGPAPASPATPGEKPVSRKFGQAHSLWKACLNKSLTNASHEPAPWWDDGLCTTFIDSWTPELQKANRAK